MTSKTLSTRQSFLAARALRKLAEGLQAENDKVTKAFGDRLPTNLKQEVASRAEEIEAYEAAATALDFDETSAS